MARYGFDDSSWSPDMRAAIEIIAGRARHGETITYGELADEIGGYTAQNLGERLLNQVIFATHRRAGCLITSVVIRAWRPRRPGDGFFATAEGLGFDVESPNDFWERQLGLTFAYFMANTV